MANLVNKIMLEGLEADFRDMGSCVVVSFDKLDVARDEEVRTMLREAGLRLRVVKNRLAVRAFKSMDLEMGEAFTGKCAVVVAPEEQAISAARLLRDALGPRKPHPLVVTGAVIEGQVIVGPAASNVADMPDRQAVRAMIATAISGPARCLATSISAVGGGLARVIQARIDKGAG
ncbi:MAG: 50S ribosomal protein L10 [Planctomycetota bacterium]